jgi:hypothetical protein
MKTIRNLVLLLVTASLLSSCLVQDQGRGRGNHGGKHGNHGHGRHRGHH